jgi:hypothetical protein
VPGFTFDYFQEIPTHAIPSAPVADDQPSYPVLIFLTGITGYRQSNTFQVEELVSHGYIVVGIDQPYAAATVVFPDGRPYTAATVVFPDGRQILGWTRDQMQPLIQQSLSPTASVPMVGGQALPNGIIPYFAQDVSITLDQLTALDRADPNGLLTGRLDLQRVGIFGISLGAIIASEACHRDARLKACLMMDAAMPADVVQAGLRQPSMCLDGKGEAQLIALACSKAPDGHQRWTVRLLADRMVQKVWLIILPPSRNSASKWRRGEIIATSAWARSTGSSAPRMHASNSSGSIL